MPGHDIGIGTHRYLAALGIGERVGNTPMDTLLVNLVLMGARQSDLTQLTAYGALVANPFGQQAFRKGPASKVVVKPGESFRLRYGVLLHDSPQDTAPDLKSAYADFVGQP